MTEEAGSSDLGDIHPKEQGWAAFFDDVFGVQWPSGEWEPEEADFAEWDKHARHKSFFFFFFFFFFGRERYSLHKCNDSNLKSM